MNGLENNRFATVFGGHRTRRLFAELANRKSAANRIYVRRSVVWCNQAWQPVGGNGSG